MTAIEPGPLPQLPRRRVPAVPSAVLGMLIFVVAEVMFFAGVMSALTIVRAGTPAGMWPPPNQPHLPVAQGAFATAALLSSAAALFAGFRSHRAGSRSARWLMAAAVALGTIFLGLQGAQGLALFAQGLTMTSSALGSFYSLIVGTHAAHVLVGLGALALALARMLGGRLTPGYFFGVQTFWYFVAVMWSVIYARLYF